MQRIQNIETIDKINKTIKLSGWVNRRRNLGKIVFLDLRDQTGLVQVVAVPGELKGESKKILGQIRPEFVVEVIGKVQARPKNQVNSKVATSKVEILAQEIEILAEAKTPPFEIDNEDRQASEEIRLKYRYLDLRHKRMRNNLILRSKVIKFFRDYLDKKGFLEVETPILTKGTPEGAREYLVPSRLYAGKFYVLPQSPQQFKQLLMVAGIEKYFQIARCFRDEDTRGDRQPEFTQLDIEMSFVDQEMIIQLTEKMMIELIKTITPNKKIIQKPFPRIDYHQAIKKYKTDKPDLRKNKKDKNELAFAWIINTPLFSYSKEEKKLVSEHHPFTAPYSKDAELLNKKDRKTLLKISAQAYDLVLNGYEIGGGSIRIHQKELQKQIFGILGLDKKRIKERFGQLLNAFEYGAPPHGGIAPGIDRIIMILANEPNIREVIAFPKTADAKDLMMKSPSSMESAKLKQANIKIDKK